MFVTSLKEVEKLSTKTGDVNGDLSDTIQWVLGEFNGAPNFELRVITLGPSGETAYHQHWWEHEVYVLAGEGVVKSEEGETPIKRHSAVFVKPDEMHQFRNTSDSEKLQFICVVPKGTR